ncbi:MAG: PAS domain-containing protein [Hyphomicrobiales bacterium]|nr:PAS domain-containing protein [Hyphomicrobiales bacterium]
MHSQNFDYSRLFAAIATPIMVLNPELCFVAMNEAYLEITKRTREELLGRFLFDAFPERPERRQRLEDALHQTLQGEVTHLKRIPFAIQEPNGEYREAYWSATHAPAYDSQGNIIAIVQHTQDVTTEVEAERLKAVVTRELQHRVGNLLTLVLTLARRTAEYEETKEDFINAFSARIQSLSETHKLLTGSHWDGLELSELIDKQLEIYTENGQHTLRVSGPVIRLSSNEAQAFSMAVHELATNAAKYGALKDSESSLQISWKKAGETGFEFEWIENCSQPVTAPERTGFGSTILLRVLPAQLGGAASRSFEETGHQYRLSVPERQVS